MNLTQKKKKLDSVNQLIEKLNDYPDTQKNALIERMELKEQIQSECNHKFVYHGDWGLCECGKTKMT